MKNTCEKCAEQTKTTQLITFVNDRAFGVEFSYPVKTLFCTCCGAPIDSPNIKGENIKLYNDARKEAYRMSNDLISLNDTKDIIEKLMLKHPCMSIYKMSKFLGFDENDLFTYYNGIKVPTKEHSDRLVLLSSTI